MTGSFYQYTYLEMRELLESRGLSVSVANKLFNWHYKKRQYTPCLQDISSEALAFIATELAFDLPVIETIQESDDRTVKFLFSFPDGKKVETVLIPSFQRYKICLSSQVGCAMKCTFCHTGLQGFERHLGPHEIVGQYLAAQRWLSENRKADDRIGTIVFMGQGEPLHNFDSVKKACEIFLSQHGLSLAADKITISTAGHLPGLQRWKNEMPDVNLALSLHSTNDEKRNELIPINAKWPLKDVLQSIDDIPRSPKRFVMYEYLVAGGFNDSETDARDLGKTLQGKKAFVNLIPFNPFPGAKYKRPSEEEVHRFKSVLDEYGVSSLVRFTRGQDILAACGQLNTRE
jgi:23S rRNA (adenine2503-C2)-methyltransferase